MAVIHPDDRMADLRSGAAHKPGELHPAVGLIVGFGVITLGAVVVDLLFRVLF